MVPPPSSASSLAHATVEALRQHLPFSAMAEADLAWLVERLSVIYQPQGATLLEAGGSPPDALFIVKQGVVEGVAPGAEAARLLQLASGEMFPLGALLTARAAVDRYVAASDVFCYRLAAIDFHALLARSRAFSEFCTRCIASLLEESQRAVQAEYALALDDENRFSRPVRSLVQRVPVTALVD